MLTENGFILKKVILIVRKSDLRKELDGLAAIVRLKYGLIRWKKIPYFSSVGLFTN